MRDAADLVPGREDLPGVGWRPLDTGAQEPGAAPDPAWAGPGLPGPEDVLETAASPHFLRPPHGLVHGIGAVFVDAGAADRARAALGAEAFARRLGRALAGDLAASGGPSEVLAVDLTTTDVGRRVTLTGSGPAGVVPVHLDVVVVGRGRRVGLVWLADSPHPFPPDDRDHLLRRLRRRS